MGNTLRVQRINEIRRHSSHSPSLTVKEYDAEKDRRHSGVTPNALGLDSERMRFLSCSPAASRRISCGSLFKINEPIGSSKSSLFAGSSLNFPFERRSTEKDDKGKDETSAKDKADRSKKLPIINPLVRSPHWPSECTLFFCSKLTFHSLSSHTNFPHVFNFILLLPFYNNHQPLFSITISFVRHN